MIGIYVIIITTIKHCSLYIYIENNGELEFIGLETETIEEAQELEQTLLDAFISSGLLANVSSKAKGLDHSLPISDYVREQNRQRMLGNKLTQGRHHDEETKRKISNANKGNQYCLGRILSEESRKKISDAQKGKVHRQPGWKHTEEAKARMSEATKGRTLSEEHKNKLSNRNYSPVVIHGIEYHNRHKAAEALGITLRIVSHRCSSVNFPDWFPKVI